MPEMDDLAALLEKNAGWMQDTSSIDPRLFEICGLYRGELTALMLSAWSTPLEVVKTRRELFSTNLAMGTSLDKENHVNVTPRQCVRQKMRSWRR